MPASEGKLVYQRGTTRRCSTLSRTGVPGLFMNGAVTGTTCNRTLDEVLLLTVGVGFQSWRVGGLAAAERWLVRGWVTAQSVTLTLVFKSGRDRPAADCSLLAAWKLSGARPGALKAQSIVPEQPSTKRSSSSGQHCNLTFLRQLCQCQSTEHSASTQHTAPDCWRLARCVTGSVLRESGWASCGAVVSLLRSAVGPIVWRPGQRTEISVSRTWSAVVHNHVKQKAAVGVGGVRGGQRVFCGGSTLRVDFNLAVGRSQEGELAGCQHQRNETHGRGSSALE